MSDPLDDVLSQMGVVLGAMTGLARWYGDPPESLSEFPAGLAFAVRGEIEAISSGYGRGLHTITIAIYLARQVLPSAVDAAKVWPHRIFTALQANQTLNGTAQAIVWPLTYRVGPMMYGADTLFGVAADVVVKADTS